MPAIDPTRLRRQTADLAEWFSRPERLLYELEALLDYYADRTQRQRSQKAGETRPLLPHHNLPAPVLARLLAELEPRAQADPQAALALADALWAKPVYETRLLACRLLGSLPASHSAQLEERARAWGAANEEENLIPALASDALARLRHETPEAFFLLVEGWLNSEGTRLPRLGLRALRTQVEETGATNLPRIYGLLQPLVHQHPTRLRPSLLRLVAALAGASAPETAYFLRAALSEGGPDTAWLVRHSLEFFPPVHAEALRAAARSAGRSR